MQGQKHMANSTVALPDEIECPLCLGKGKLSRTETLERLGLRNLTRVAELTAQEAIRLLSAQGDQAEQARWARFEAELSRRLAEVTSRHNAELQRAQGEKSELAARLKSLEQSTSATLDNARQQARLAAEQESQEQLAALTGQVAELEAARKLADEQRYAEVATVRAELEIALGGERTKANDAARQASGYLQEIESLRGRNQLLETEMTKVARVGRKEEMDFADEARSWPGIWIGEKLPKTAITFWLSPTPPGTQSSRPCSSTTRTK
jgi:hypothetical protein